jgi:hypothetical protein
LNISKGELEGQTKDVVCDSVAKETCPVERVLDEADSGAERVVPGDVEVDKGVAVSASVATN